MKDYLSNMYTESFAMEKSFERAGDVGMGIDDILNFFESEIEDSKPIKLGIENMWSSENEMVFYIYYKTGFNNVTEFELHFKKDESRNWVNMYRLVDAHVSDEYYKEVEKDISIKINSISSHNLEQVVDYMSTLGIRHQIIK